MQPSVTIQTSPELVPAIPPWFGEVAAVAQVLTHTGILKTIQEQVRFARACFGHYDLIDPASEAFKHVKSTALTAVARQR